VSNGLLDSPAKNPTKVRAGTIGARQRWGPEPRVVRLDELTGPQRRLVLALVDAARKEATTEDQNPVVAASEVHGNARPPD
jgi:hypothetical protein